MLPFEPRDSPQDVLQAVKDHINHQDVNGETPIFLAAHYGNLDQIKVLLKAGADLTIKDAFGDTVIQFAIDRKNLKNIVYLMKEGGADVIETRHYQQKVDDPIINECLRRCRRNQMMCRFPGPVAWTGPKGGCLGLPTVLSDMILEFASIY